MAAVTVQEAHGAIACIGRLSAVYQQRRQQLAVDVGLTEHQWEVLEEISTEHFMPSMFARSRQSSRAAISKTLRQLLTKGFVRVSAGADDGRQRHYELSALGRRTLEALRGRRELAIVDVWLALNRTELKAFTCFGNDLAKRLEDYATSAKKE